MLQEGLSPDIIHYYSSMHHMVVRRS